MNIYQTPSLEEVQLLLQQSNLPTSDLSDLNLDHFYAYGESGNVQGVIGLEVYGSDALLRSFAVSSNAQGKGCGAALLSQLEQHAIELGIKHLYLLTNTAEQYFLKKGFEKIARELAPDSIKLTAEFSDLCPASAVLMHKIIAI